MPLVKTAAEILASKKSWAQIITPEKLEQLAREGHVPCWQSPNGNFFFEKESLEKWLFGSYLQYQEGLPLQRVLPVVLPEVTSAEVPQELVLLASALRRIPFATGVYFLVDDRQVVYVGKSENVCSRVPAHMTDKMFSDVLWLPVRRDVLDSVEAAFITTLRPHYNGKHTVPAEHKDQDHDLVISEALKNVPIAP